MAHRITHEDIAFSQLVSKHLNENRRLYSAISLAGLVPFVITLLNYMFGINTYAMTYIYEIINKFPAITFTSNPQISAILSFYWKLAPVFALISILSQKSSGVTNFIYNCKTTEAKHIKKKALQFFIGFLFLVVMPISISIDIGPPRAGRLVIFAYLVQLNEVTLTVFYLIIFYLNLLITWYTLFTLLLLCKLLNRKTV